MSDGNEREKVFEIEVPDDFADAIEAMKLSILRHKAADWRELSANHAGQMLIALAMVAIRDDTTLEKISQTPREQGSESELAALRAECAEWKHLAEIRAKGICELTEQLAEKTAEVELHKSVALDYRRQFTEAEGRTHSADPTLKDWKYKYEHEAKLASELRKDRDFLKTQLAAANAARETAEALANSGITFLFYDAQGRVVASIYQKGTVFGFTNYSMNQSASDFKTPIEAYQAAIAANRIEQPKGDGK